MRHKKFWFQSALIAVAAVAAAAAGFCIVPVNNYIAGRNTPLEEDYFSSEAVAAAASVAIPDEAIQELLSGSVTLDEVYAQLNFTSAFDFLPSEEGAAAAEPAASHQTEPPDQAVPASSASSNQAEVPKPADSSAASSSSDASSASSAESSAAAASPSEAAYEQELKVLIQQLYSVKARAESGLNQCIQAASSEYHALPAEQQTQARKIAICFSKAGQLSALQASCDQEVNRIVREMRQLLTENGQSTALADSAEATYKSEKSSMYSSLMSQLYG